MGCGEGLGTDLRGLSGGGHEGVSRGSVLDPGAGFNEGGGVGAKGTHFKYSVPHVKVHSSPWPSLTLD